MNLLSFDIELSDVFDLAEHEDIEAHAPLHIALAATAIHGGEERVWYSETDGKPALNLSQQCAHELLEYLEARQQEGFMVCAWNGLGFDLKWLGHQANDLALAARIALKSYDPMFQFFNQAGFPVGLGKVAQSMGVTQVKTMNGVDAPRQWQAGNHQQVMDYCLGDCQMTNQVVLAIQQAGQVRWLTARGKLSAKPLPRLKTVEEVLREPEPDQSWMDTPMPRLKFHQWVQDVMTLPA